MKLTFYAILKFIKNVFQSYNGPPYAIWQDRICANTGDFSKPIDSYNDAISKQKISSGNINDIPPPIGDLYIWPDRIRWYFFIYGLLLFVVPVISNWNLISVVIGSIGFLLELIVGPFLVFFVFRIKVLERFKDIDDENDINRFKHVPLFTTAIKINTLPLNNRVQRLKNYCWNKLQKLKRFFVLSFYLLPFISNPKDPVYFMKGGSFQESCIKYGASELFQTITPVETNVCLSREEINEMGAGLPNKTLMRLLLYWVSPVITCYLIIFFESIVFALYPQYSSAKALSISTLLWLFTTVAFFVRERNVMCDWLNFTRDDEYFFYPKFVQFSKTGLWNFHILLKPDVFKMIGVCNSFGATILFIFIQIVKYNSIVLNFNWGVKFWTQIF